MSGGTSDNAFRHELLTPLSQIIGYAELLLEEAQDTGGAMVADLEKIRSAGQLLLERIRGGPGMPPARASHSGSVPMPSPERAEHGAEHTGRLLLVDDEEVNRDLLSRMLRKQGHEVEGAASGPEALALIGERLFDLVLLDVRMPEMDGHEVLHRLKAEPRLRHVPVIMISALDELDSVVRCIELGAEDYLQKPCNPVLLHARIGACLEKKRLRDQELRLTEELRTNYQRLKTLEGQRDEMVHLLMHDLRTPLTSLLLGIAGISRVGPLNERQERLVTRARRGGETLLGMLSDVLDVSKMEEAALRMEPEPAPAGELVEQALAQVQWLAEHGEIRLLREVAPELPPLRCDPEKVVRVLVNLVGNAIRFTPREGMVTVSVRDDGAGGQVFSVRDTGQGIPREAFGRIFEKFGQAAARKEGQMVSTGLGLTFCKLAVEAHGGRVWVESELGQGSTFSFVIPTS